MAENNFFEIFRRNIKLWKFLKKKSTKHKIYLRFAAHGFKFARKTTKSPFGRVMLIIKIAWCQLATSSKIVSKSRPAHCSIKNTLIVPINRAASVKVCDYKNHQFIIIYISNSRVNFLSFKFFRNFFLEFLKIIGVDIQLTLQLRDHGLSDIFYKS